MRVRGMIFDVDGTLSDSIRICYEAFREAVEVCTGNRISDLLIAREFGPSEEGIMRSLVPDAPQRGLYQYLDAYTRLCQASLEPIPGLTEELTALHRQGILLGVVTGKGEHSTSITLQHLETVFKLPNCVNTSILLVYVTSTLSQ